MRRPTRKNGKRRCRIQARTVKRLTPSSGAASDTESLVPERGAFGAARFNTDASMPLYEYDIIDTVYFRYFRTYCRHKSQKVQ